MITQQIAATQLSGDDPKLYTPFNRFGRRTLPDSVLRTSSRVCSQFSLQIPHRFLHVLIDVDSTGDLKTPCKRGFKPKGRLTGKICAAEWKRKESIWSKDEQDQRSTQRHGVSVSAGRQGDVDRCEARLGTFALMMVLPDRQVVGFALCGVLLDMTFVILLSAARDLIVDSSLPTSAVLAAAILPLWALKVAAPWFVDRGSYMFKVTAASLVGVASLCATALLPNVYMKLLFGVATGAVATALGEVTFFALVSRYPKRCVLALTAGTGLCGLCGSGLYYCFTEILQLSTKSTLLFASCLPLTLVFAFAEFLRPVPAMLDETVEELVVEDPVLGQAEYEDSALLKKEESERIAAGRRTRSTGLQMSVKLDFVRTQLLVDYMIPLFTIFFCGYLINQGVVPVITFDSPWTSTRGQYPLFLFVANIGGLLARASPLVFEVDCLHALAFSIVGILVALIVHAYHSFIPNLTSFLALAFVEGALGGLVFVNAFRLINKHVTDERLREFGMGVVSVADATGVVFAAGVGLVLEPALASAQLG